MGPYNRATPAPAAALAVLSALVLTGCATQSAPIVVKDAPHSVDVQKQMQKDMAVAAAAQPVLKRKIALGSLTEFGRKTVGESGFFSSSKKQVAFA